VGSGVREREPTGSLMIIPQIHSRGESADKLPEADSNIYRANKS
jgi:hypothetical protein